VQLSLFVSSPGVSVTTLTYKDAEPKYRVGESIYENKPTFAFNPPVESFPALPSGLQLDPDTGIISGTPTSTSPRTRYLLQAGQLIASIFITVVDGKAALGSCDASEVGADLSCDVAMPTSIIYARSELTLTLGVRMATMAPLTSVGRNLVWTVDPPLPAGLTLNSSTGNVSGTPTVLSASRAYVIQAANTGGSSAITLFIEVDSGE